MLSACCLEYCLQCFYTSYYMRSAGNMVTELHACSYYKTLAMQLFLDPNSLAVGLTVSQNLRSPPKIDLLLRCNCNFSPL